MPTTNRRSFLKQSAAGAAALSLAPAALAAGANDKIVLGVIGCGGRGTHVAEVFAAQKNVGIGYVCDVDDARRERAAKAFAEHSPKAVGDMRRVFEDKAVDAVLVATPDHWHSPAAILACDAGKHVYVEKPCSHNIREGRLLVEAARKNKRVVQHGTQSRSTSMMIEAIEQLRAGVIGNVLVAKAWNIQRRGSIGKLKPSDPPKGLDWDLWLGPAPHIPYQVNVHGGWHWWYALGTGDMGNDGVHDIDYCRWGLFADRPGVETHPSVVSAVGGKYFFDDDQQFPDTQQVAFEYPGDGQPGSKRMLIYEQRLWSSNYPFNVDSGVEFYGTKGKMFLSRRGKIQTLDAANKPIELNIKPRAQDEEAHVANFLAAIHGAAKANAEIEIGHVSTTLCHLGNIATRLGRSLRFDPKTEKFVNDEEANRLVWREYRKDHWSAPKG